MQRMGLTYDGLAKLLGVSRRTVLSWLTEEEASSRAIPAPAARFLAFLDRAGITPDEVESILK
jgi:DNA-binding transcriptional regulator YiaG